MGLGDTIAAIATAPGRGGVAVIRVSGPDAREVARALAGEVPAPGSFRFARFRHPATGAMLDEGLVLAFAAPRSYTGEDVVELQGHGGAVAPRRVLEACFAAGARAARRGEFTERAFLNGRLGYDAAESVLDLIDAKTDRAADAALAGLHGRKERALKALYDETLALSATVEHALDVDEGDLTDDFFTRLDKSLATLRGHLGDALRRLREGKILREGALVVLVGPPNAGKSSLLNALLGENRAIVSPTAGTTRDTIEEWIDLDGWPVRLVDTAGLRETADQVEAEGVRRAESLMERADVILRLVPPGDRLPDDDDPRAIVIHSKADLAGARSLPRGRVGAPSPTASSRPRAAPPPTAPTRSLSVSATTGAGLGELRVALVARLAALASRTDDLGASPDTLVAALLAAERLLPASAADLVLAGTALARAAQSLAAPLGAIYSEDLLSSLFSRFCVGK